MTGSTTLTREAAHAARKMYLEVNQKTGRKWTIIDLSEFFAVSEGTMWRAIKGYGAYRNLPPARTEEEMSAESAASLKKLMDLTKDLREKEARGDKMVEELRGEKDDRL